MTTKCNVATWNLCLGIQNKKNIVKETIINNKIDICCMQEVEIPPDFPTEILSFPGYSIEVESNDVKSRVAIYVSDKLKFERRKDLEGINSNLMVIDILQDKHIRIVNLYRAFKPQNNVSPRNKFQYQLELIKNMMCANIIILGDFNLDESKKFNVDYVHRNLFQDLNETLADFDLLQIVNFNTWSRLVNGTLKSSILDHVYTSDVTNISNLNFHTPNFGDHFIVTFDIIMNKNPPITSIQRDWRQYSKNKLCDMLSILDWNINVDDVQEYWNIFENMLIDVIDNLAPLITFVGNEAKETKPPKPIKNAINVRHRLLKIFRKNPSIALKARIVSIDKEIKSFYKSAKTKKVRKGILPGNSKSLWKAVNIAKDINCTQLPDKLYQNGIEIPTSILADTFAEFFDKKVKLLIEETTTNRNVYNGKLKVNSNEKIFMNLSEVIECIKSIKIKNSEGYDRIPQRVLVDGAIHLASPLACLFSLIYTKNKIPEQWLIAKVTPIYKKGAKNDVANYRPISNLCSTSKIFEKLILNRIMEIQKENDVDLSGVEQHGFKKFKSTASAGLIIQSLIARAMDSNKYALMASIDLSAAFDLVNTKLLLKRLKIIGLPPDILRLIELWLTKRSFYVNINGKNSYIVKLIGGTIQGSILGPLLYAIYVSPLFDLLNVTNFADDNFVIRWNNCIEALISDMKKDLEAMTKWLKDSGLKVNESKTEVCLFHQNDCQPISFFINDSKVTSSSTMNVLGITFDSKLQWSNQVNNCIRKSLRALHAIRLIKSHFTTDELKQLITSNFYSILYYNSEIWHLPNLNPISKRHLLSASASALKICTPTYNREMSFRELHTLNLRATPNQFLNYKHAILLYNVYNSHQPPQDWLSLNFNQILTRRQNNFEVVKAMNFKVGFNMISNRLST